MLTKQGKAWGETTEFFRNALVSAHHLSIKKGGFCSEHKHAQKYNLFYVLQGKLKIIIWRDKTTKDITVLGPGQSTAVSPDFYHKFEAMTDVECIEMYQVFLEDPDIERRTEGGLKK